MKTTKGSPAFPTSTSMPAISHLSHVSHHVRLSHPSHTHAHVQHHAHRHHVTSSSHVPSTPTSCQLPINLTPAVESVIQHHQQQQQQLQLEVLRKRQYRVGLNVFNKGPPEVRSRRRRHPFHSSREPCCTLITNVFSFHSFLNCLTHSSLTEGKDSLYLCVCLLISAC